MYVCICTHINHPYIFPNHILPYPHIHISQHPGPVFLPIRFFASGYQSYHNSQENNPKKRKKQKSEKERKGERKRRKEKKKGEFSKRLRIRTKRDKQNAHVLYCFVQSDRGKKKEKIMNVCRDKNKKRICPFVSHFPSPKFHLFRILFPRVKYGSAW